MVNKFPFNKLPIDLQGEILSNLDIITLNYYSSIFSYDTIYATLKIKYSNLDDNKIRGTINNFDKKCYLCGIYLYRTYTMILCQNCSLDFDSKNVYYPELCLSCSNIKIERGKTLYSRCKLCGIKSTYLGISIFS